MKISTVDSSVVFMKKREIFQQKIVVGLVITAVVFATLATVSVSLYQRFHLGALAPTAPSSQPAASEITSNTCTSNFVVPPADPCLQTTKTAVLSCDQNGPVADVTLGVKSTCPTVDPPKPLDVMIVIDRSGSIGQNLPAIQVAAHTLVNQLNPQTDFVGVTDYGFDGHLILSMNPLTPASGSQSVSDAIDTATFFDPNTFDFNQGTNIGDGVFIANQDLQAHRRSDATPVMIFLTDGVANSRHVTSGLNSCFDPAPESSTLCTQNAIDEAKIAKDAGVTLFTIGLDMTNDSWSQATSTLAKNTLVSMASSTNSFFEATTATDLNGIFSNIATIINTTAATNVKVNDFLPTGITLVPGTAFPEGTVNGQSLTWDLGSLGQNTTSTMHFKIRFADNVTPDQLVDVFPNSVLNYTDQNGDSFSLPFPETRLSPNLACPSPTPTANPTTAISNTPSPTFTPSDTPTDTQTPNSGTPTTTPPGLPKAGNTAPTMLILGIGIGAILLGVIAVLLLI